MSYKQIWFWVCFFVGGRGDVRDQSHEDVVVALLMRTSSWPYSQGRPTIGKQAAWTCDWKDNVQCKSWP